MRGFTYEQDRSWLERNVFERVRGRQLPISEKQAHQVTTWFKGNYQRKIESSIAGTPFTAPVLCAIACQETAYFWLPMLKNLTAEQLLARCVLDASGDHPDSPRSAFPRDTDAFRSRYGGEFSNMLIAEANETRKLRGLGPKDWVYKGYGVFQYDLQFVVEDEEFFRAKKWCEIDQCLARVMQELKEKYARTKSLWPAVKAYNGSGSRAQEYMENVQQFHEYTTEAWAAAPDQPPEAPPAPPADAAPVLPDAAPAPVPPAEPPAVS